jgi:hypothetical protein
MRNNPARGRTFSDVGVEQESTLRNRHNHQSLSSARVRRVNGYLGIWLSGSVLFGLEESPPFGLYPGTGGNAIERCRSQSVCAYCRDGAQDFPVCTRQNDTIIFVLEPNRWIYQSPKAIRRIYLSSE